MSEFKNDSNHKKQNLVILLSTFFAVILLYFSASGAILECDLKQNCIIIRKSVFNITKDEFNWKEVKNVRLTSQASYSKKGSYGSNYSLELNSNQEIFIFLSSLAWPIGTLTREALESQINKENIFKYWAVSLGGASWFISFILGFISFTFTLLKFSDKISENMPVEELSNARKKNLKIFALVILFYLVFWGIILNLLFYNFGYGLYTN